MPAASQEPAGSSSGANPLDIGFCRICGTHARLVYPDACCSENCHRTRVRIQAAAADLDRPPPKKPPSQGGPKIKPTAVLDNVLTKQKAAAKATEKDAGQSAADAYRARVRRARGGGGPPNANDDDGDDDGAVSYTHLTLPTILRV